MRLSPMSTLRDSPSGLLRVRKVIEIKNLLLRVCEPLDFVWSNIPNMAANSIAGILGMGRKIAKIKGFTGSEFSAGLRPTRPGCENGRFASNLGSKRVPFSC
jgi:hypothetical protein